MVKEEAIKKVLDVAKSYIGYLEKASKENLDDPKANIGSGNYTKFARDFFPELQGLEWCCMFVYSCFAYAFGGIMAQNILSGCKTAKCSVLQEAMLKNNKIVKSPEKGDLVFFKNNLGNISHIGIVSNVNGNRIETIEGNTSVGNNVVIASGGGVYQKYYDISNTKIHSFGKPSWELVSNISISQNEGKKSDIGTVNAINVNIRKDAGTYNPVVGMVTKNDKLKVLGEKKDSSGFKWYKVEFGSSGYIRSDYLDI